VHRATVWPLSPSPLARAVPQLPAPKTPILMRGSYRNLLRMASGGMVTNRRLLAVAVAIAVVIARADASRAGAVGRRIAAVLRGSLRHADALGRPVARRAGRERARAEQAGVAVLVEDAVRTAIVVALGRHAANLAVATFGRAVDGTAAAAVDQDQAARDAGGAIGVVLLRARLLLDHRAAVQALGLAT